MRNTVGVRLSGKRIMDALRDVAPLLENSSSAAGHRDAGGVDGTFRGNEPQALT